MSDLAVILLFLLALAAICCGGGAPSSPHPAAKCADKVRVVAPTGEGTLVCHSAATASVVRDENGGAVMLCTCPKPAEARDVTAP